MPFLTFPFALVAAVALPALVAVYWLRNRHRRKVVSSLMLFMDRQRPREGGVRVQRSGLPPLFWLELLALLLLALAATDPQFRLSREERPLVVVLDDSYSMLAGGTDSVRARAELKLNSILADNRGEPMRLILAGREPSTLGEVFRSPQDARKLMDSWTCRSPSADMPRALAMARETAGSFARILVLTDAAPTDGMIESHLMRWISLGQPRANLAIVNASRVLFEKKHRILLEVANYSDHAVTTTLKIQRVGAVDPADKSSLDLGAKEIKRLVFEIPATSETLNISLPEDSLPIDNSVTLYPPATRTVRLRQDFSSPLLKALVTDAVDASSAVQSVTTTPDLIITDDPVTDALPGSDTWVVRFLGSKQSQAYLGPFILDRTHPLTQGLSLDGVIWTADAAPSTQPSAQPSAVSTTQPKPVSPSPNSTPSGATDPSQDQAAGVIAAGNVSLLTDQLHVGGTHTLIVHFVPELSTLQQTPGWPVMLWNLVQWRSLELPGPSRSLVRLGEALNVTLPRGALSLKLVDPLGRARELRTADRSVTVPCDVTGDYQLTAGLEHYVFSCAPMSPEGSDLTKKSPGEWGEWKEQGETRSAYRPIGWSLALAALLVLCGHAFLVYREGSKAQG